MTEPWTVPAAAVPVVAQHRDAVLDMSDAGSAGADTVADALDAIDLDALRAVGGHFDLDALAALEAPLTDVRGALMDLQEATKDARSPWLVDRADVELDDFEGSIDDHLPPLERSLRAIRLAPGMLGADAPRTYLVLFTTPSEARGLGGFVGSYAELTVDDGQLDAEQLRPDPGARRRGAGGRRSRQRPAGLPAAVRPLRVRHRRRGCRRRRPPSGT